MDRTNLKSFSAVVTQPFIALILGLTKPESHMLVLQLFVPSRLLPVFMAPGALSKPSARVLAGDDCCSSLWWVDWYRNRRPSPEAPSSKAA